LQDNAFGEDLFMKVKKTLASFELGCGELTIFAANIGRNIYGSANVVVRR
jgi:hypothetical protein